MDRCITWKPDELRLGRAVRALRVAAMTCSAIVSAIVVRLHSSATSLLTRLAPIVASSCIARLVAPADRVVVQEEALALMRLRRSCSLLMPIEHRRSQAQE